MPDGAAGAAVSARAGGIEPELVVGAGMAGVTRLRSSVCSPFAWPRPGRVTGR